MLFWTIIKSALKSIVANKMRSFLTILGIIIGIASVITMLGFGQGLRDQIVSSMRRFGTNMLTIRPEWRRDASGARSGNFQTLKVSDAETLLRELPEVVMVSPELSTSCQLKFMNANDRMTVYGVAPTIFAIRNYELENGRTFTDDEITRGDRVVVLGAKAATTLFEDAVVEPLGQTVKISNRNFRIIGVTKPKDEWSDNCAFIPITPHARQISGATNVNQIYLKIGDKYDLDKAQESVTAVMRRLHHMQANDENDFRIRNRQEALDSLNMVGTVLRILLGGIAGIALFVGGINIMNIMLVTVTERTREIGIRKAIGARKGAILSQFMIESVVMSCLGGLIGILLGAGLLEFVNYRVPLMGEGQYASFYAPLDPFYVALSFCFSALVGIFFGIYPARKAASLDPIEALRYE